MSGPTQAPLSTWQRLRYWFDNSLTRGVWIIIVLTAVAMLGIILMISGVVWATQVGPEGRAVPFPEALWLSLTRSLDGGTVGADRDGWFRVFGIAVTLIGLLAVAIVIGLVTNAVDRRVTELRKGRSMVAETDHSLILGYSPLVPIIVSELLEATERTGRWRRHRHKVVILSRWDTDEVEDKIKRARNGLDPRTGRAAARRWRRVVVRKGIPSSVSDLMKVRPQDARHVVVVRPEAIGRDAEADAEVVKTSLAVARIRHHADRSQIVAELTDLATADALREAATFDQEVRSHVLTVVSTDVIAQIAAQTSRSAGLGAVYDDLLNFQGVEFHIVGPNQDWEGMHFADTLLAFPRATVVGLVKDGSAASLCPVGNPELMSGDRLIVIAEDDAPSSLHCEPIHADRLRMNSVMREAVPVAPEDILLVGWNRVAPRMVEQIAAQVGAESRITVLVDPKVDRPVDAYLAAGTVAVNSLVRPTIDRSSIREVLGENEYDHIILLCDHRKISAARSDARTLLTLLHIRQVLDETPRTRETNLVSEILEPEAVDIAKIAKPDDFIVSQRLISRLLSQLAVTPELSPVLEDLFDTEGTQLVTRSLDNLALAEGEYTFASLVEATAPSGLLVVGWPDKESKQGERSFTLNPHKEERLHLSGHDALVALERKVDASSLSAMAPYTLA